MRSKAARLINVATLMTVFTIWMSWGVNGEGVAIMEAPVMMIGESMSSPVTTDDLTEDPKGAALSMSSQNAAYLDADWFNGMVPMTDEQMKDRILELQHYHIQYQLADIGILLSGGGALNGTLPEDGYKQLARWIRITRETAPEQKVIAVVNDGNRTTWRTGKKTAISTFGNATYQTNLKTLADKLVNQGLPDSGSLYKADGIQLDIEGFLPNDQILVDTAKVVGSVLPATAIYSISTPADPAVWSDAYVSEMAGIFNMLNPMMYDQQGWGSAVDSPEAYRQFWTATTVRYARVIAASGHPDTMLIPTMPAYERKTTEDGTMYHDPAIENIANAAQGLRHAQAQLELDRALTPAIHANGVHGAGIFWWSSFIAASFTLRDPHDYASDRQSWLELWVGN